MQNKKIVCSAMAAVMALSLAACGNKTELPDSSATESAPPTEQTEQNSTPVKNEVSTSQKAEIGEDQDYIFVNGEEHLLDKNNIIVNEVEKENNDDIDESYLEDKDKVEEDDVNTKVDGSGANNEALLKSKYDKNNNKSLETRELPRATSETFHMSGEDAQLYDAVAEFKYKEEIRDTDKTSTNLIVPIVSVFDKYEKDGITNYICMIGTKVFDEFGKDANHLDSSSSSELSNLGVISLKDGKFIGADVLSIKDMTTYKSRIAEICGPLKELSERLQKNDETLEPRNLMPDDILGMYKAAFF